MLTIQIKPSPFKYAVFASIYLILACCLLVFFFTECAKRYIIFCYIQIIMAISMTVYFYLPLITGVEADAVNFHQKQFFTTHLRYNLYYPSLLINYFICIYFFRKSARYHLENIKNDMFYKH
ncbi:hypothetical protein CRE_09556 [Caenorhabditis remanei]|uniref:Uncharacterized protein n=1 Tax=Caenorhabditis remanei TaxID=31234 RepID=E3MIV6_CAERE|nr:hypothetical protein CRE_09556 [Caenorhabditis remanei]